MLGIERRKAIMERLKKDEKVYVRDLARDFQVTEETVRRDLERLEKEDLLSRNYGGAVLKAPVADALSFTRRTFVNSDGKERIARKAFSVISGFSRIMLDAGTTALALLTYLKGERGITVVTNSARALTLASDGAVTLYSTGGKLKRHALALTGPTAVKAIRGYKADVACVACKGLDLVGGVLESDEDEAIVKQEMLNRAAKRILLADNTKFNRAAFSVIAPWDTFDMIITDEEPAAEWKDVFARHGVELVVAGPEAEEK